MRKEHLLYAKQMLVNKNCTCVLYDGKTAITSTKRGVTPLLEWVEEGKDFNGFVAADKVVGRATAFLYVLLKVRTVYAKVISKGAVKVFDKYDIEFTYDEITDEIINRKGNGCCPMEEATRSIEDAETALDAIRKRYIELNK